MPAAVAADSTELPTGALVVLPSIVISTIGPASIAAVSAGAGFHHLITFSDLSIHISSCRR
ncbi:MAG: hypothetical protein ACR2I0_12430, partial [Rhodoferax sp.]